MFHVKHLKSCITFDSPGLRKAKAGVVDETTFFVGGFGFLYHLY